MIQFNLLPDVKLEYIRSRRTKRVVMLSSLGVAGLAIGVFVLMFVTVNVLQKQHLNNLSDDIKRDSQKLREVDQLDKILTVQNQLGKLPELHDGKAVLSRLKTYITFVTPAQVNYASIDIDTVASTMRFSGSADSIKTVNQFVDTLKFTKYKQDGSEQEANAFSEVVLASFGKEKEGARFEINLKYDPLIFSNAKEVSLSVPNIITTRSATERPDENLIQPLGSPTTGGGL